MADHLALTPSTSSDSMMEGHSRPAKTATLSFAHIPNLATLEHINMNLPFPTGRNPADAYRPGRIENRLALWYHRNDGPWTPPGLTSPQGDLRNPALLSNLRANPLVFHQYRESIVSSECDTIAPGVVPSDSGYAGSYGAKHSVANGSVCEESLDRNQETQSLTGHIGDLSFQSYSQDMIPKGGVNPETPWPQSQQSPSPSSAMSRQFGLESKICEICHKVLKTKSEFKKHKQRHDKPFKCTVKNCTRHEGFSTPNDLDRHVRSLHPGEAASGNRYRCPIGACRNKDKIWPRADNFRAHMKRVHQREKITDNDLDQYKFRPIASSKNTPDLPHDGAAPASDRFMFPDGSDNWTLPRNPVIDLSTEASPIEGPDQVQIEETSLVDESSDEGHMNVSNDAPVRERHSEGDDVSLDAQIEMTRPPSTQPRIVYDNTEFVKSSQVDNSGSDLDYRKMDSELANELVSTNHEKADNPKETQDDPKGSPLESPQSTRQLENPVDIDNDSNACSKARGPDEMTDLDLTDHNGLLKLLEKLRSSGVLGRLGYKKDDSPEQEVAKQESTRNAPDQAHTCSECQKSFGRRCELKKHEKRHLKPYGCTFPDCKKKFGSKNDWKRHENSQHYMEHWRCEEKQTSDSTDTCGKVLPRRELFKQHLTTCHRIKDSVLLETKVENCRVGRNSEVRFWCGFCRQIIEVKKDAVGAWAERFNHIDDHFHGRNNQEKREIGDWQNEYSPNDRAESPANDSEDSSVTSTPTTSTNISDTPDHARLEKRHDKTMKQKRKRDDGWDESAKRLEIEEMARYHCCQCREIMPVTSKQCTNYPCDHKLCVDCY